MVIVDSSVLIDLLNRKVNPHTLWLEGESGRYVIGLTDLILYEVLQGARSESNAQAIQERLLRFQVWDTGGIQRAVAAAANFRKLRLLGVTVRKTVDCLIASFCIADGHQLLHRDRDFDAFETHLGLSVIHPPEAGTN
jgi:predicted nucleic acid-binding protein